jgi:octopine/nopaline transport system ATP-binding protein
MIYSAWVTAEVAIAYVLATGSEVILFDDPTSALDPEFVGEVLKFARDVSSRVIYLYKGQIEEGGPPSQVFGAPNSARRKQFVSGLEQVGADMKS